MSLSFFIKPRINKTSDCARNWFDCEPEQDLRVVIGGTLAPKGTPNDKRDSYEWVNPDRYQELLSQGLMSGNSHIDPQILFRE